MGTTTSKIRSSSGPQRIQQCKYGDTEIPLRHDAACPYCFKKFTADHSHASVKQDEWPLRHKGGSHVYSSFYYRQNTAHVADIM